MCNVSLMAKKSSNESQWRLSLDSINIWIFRDRVGWLGQVEQIDGNFWVKKCRNISVNGHLSNSGPQKTWEKVTHGDLKALNIKCWNRLEQKRGIKKFINHISIGNKHNIVYSYHDLIHEEFSILVLIYIITSNETQRKNTIAVKVIAFKKY